LTENKTRKSLIKQRFHFVV